MPGEMKLLQIYSDGSFGYRGIDDRQNDLEVVETQDKEESREEFFCRVGARPKRNEYCSSEIMDAYVNSDEDDRIYAAGHGYALEKLKHDPDAFVRAEVVNKGYDLDYFLYDDSSTVRIALARSGYGLDQLVNDPDQSVRSAVAKHGYMLDFLINDSNIYVRAEVAKHGYGINCLIKDEEYLVRTKANKILQEFGGDIESWKNTHKDLVFDEKSFCHYYDLLHLIIDHFDEAFEILETFPEELTDSVINKVLNNSSLRAQGGVAIINLVLNVCGYNKLFECYDPTIDGGRYFYQALVRTYPGSKPYKNAYNFFLDEKSRSALIEFMSNNAKSFFDDNGYGWKIYEKLEIKLLN